MTANATEIQRNPHVGRRTALLGLLTFVSGICMVASYVYFTNARAAAMDANATRTAGLADLKVLGVLDRSAAPAAAPTGDDSQMNQQLRAAAINAGMSDQLLSIEPGQPQQVRDTDMKDTPVFLQLNGVSLRQVVAFLRRLGEQDAHVIARNILLTAPNPSDKAAKAADSELWTADVTLAYLTYNPRGKAAP